MRKVTSLLSPPTERSVIGHGDISFLRFRDDSGIAAIPVPVKARYLPAREIRMPGKKCLA